MPPRGEKPGFKRGRPPNVYWIASQVVKDPMGFPDSCIPLPPDASDDELGELCRGHTARLLAWIDERQAQEPAATLTRYNGTVLAACRIYQEHPLSNFQTVKFNTRKTYLKDLRVIEATVGPRLIRNVTVLDVKKWYNEWRRPAEPGGPERIDRAHDAVAMFRTVIYFNAALRNADCKVLASELERVKFESGASREQELTYEQAVAFIRTAIDFDQRGIMPPGRAINIAIGTITQFELMLRQNDVIGEYAADGVKRKLPPAVETLQLEGETWAGYYTWEKIAGWHWRMKTSKSKYRVAAHFDLTKYGLLMPLLEAVPHHERTGAIVKGAKGLPVRADMYRRWFRDIARAAEIPDDVKNMDSRAGGAGEADDSQAPLDLIRDGLTHTRETTTLRYLRRNREKKIGRLADLRQAKRAASDGDGTG